MWKKVRELMFDSAIYGASDVLSKIIGFLLLPLFTHYLTDAEYGALAMFAFIKMFFTPIANLGMTNAMFRTFALAKNVQQQFTALSAGLVSVCSASCILGFVPLGWNFEDENPIGRKHYLFHDAVLPMGGVYNETLAFGNNNKIPNIKLFESLKAYKSEHKKPIYFASDGHWNSEGHLAVTQILIPVIEKWLAQSKQVQQVLAPNEQAN